MEFVNFSYWIFDWRNNRIDILWGANMTCRVELYWKVIRRTDTCQMFRHEIPLSRKLSLYRRSESPGGGGGCNLKIISIPVACIFYYFALWPINAQLFHKLSHCYMFRHYRVILRELVTNTLPSYSSISNATVGNTVLYFALWPTNAQLFHKLSHCYMFRHYRVILRQPVINTLPSYTSISNAAVGNTVLYFALWPTNAQLFHKLSHCYMFRHYVSYSGSL